MNTSNLFRLNTKDFYHGALLAVSVAAVTTLHGIMLTPGFDIFHADWIGIGQSVANFSFSAFVGYIVKNFISDDSGKVLGKIG